VKILEALPAVFVPVMVYSVDTAFVVGVPEINPDEELKERPALNDGEMEYWSIWPPVEVIEYPVMADPTLPDSFVEESVKLGTLTACAAGSGLTRERAKAPKRELAMILSTENDLLLPTLIIT
jgi:hypothetical protein